MSVLLKWHQIFITANKYCLISLRSPFKTIDTNNDSQQIKSSSSWKRLPPAYSSLYTNTFLILFVIILWGNSNYSKLLRRLKDPSDSSRYILCSSIKSLLYFPVLSSCSQCRALIRLREMCQWSETCVKTEEEAEKRHSSVVKVDVQPFSSSLHTSALSGAPTAAWSMLLSADIHC